MKPLNLTADTPELQRIKDYLQENASDALADKINNGTPFKKDGKPLINKKNLTGFMQYAVDEARKLAEKGARYACIEDKTVFGWAIHYFEEDSTLGSLFYLDGAEYKPAQKIKSKPADTPAIKVKATPKKESLQFSLFDALEEEKPEPQKDDELDNAIKGQVITEDGEIIDYEDFDGDVVDEPTDELKPVSMPLQEPKGSPLYQRYKSIQDAYLDSVVAMRLGDFYEVFGELATTVANELDLTLTGRDCGFAARVPMCGFPYHCADAYFKRINAVHNLIIVESDNDKDTRYLPKTENKPPIEELQQEQETAKAFDKVALCILADIFDKDLEIR
ncbi:MAG: Cas9 inhibitor AcrIIA9 family protein [Clostridia bacterium]|nr:Cas9 inhibitor AcrIIA9 family protein [Clostridia bacterium]